MTKIPNVLSVISPFSAHGTAAFTWSACCWRWFYLWSPDAGNNRKSRSAFRPANRTVSPLLTTTATRSRKPHEGRTGCVVRNSDINTERHRAAISSLRSERHWQWHQQGINSSNNTEKRDGFPIVALLELVSFWF